ncbi:MazG nucleotide pyrophosphohydrolase domain-containing protein [Thermococcus atlanticus]
MNELQRDVDRLVKEFGGYWEPFEMLAAVTEELGELAREMLELQGVKGRGDRERLEEELGDLLFSISCIANFYGVDIFEALRKSISKYRERDSGRWLKHATENLK